MGDPKEDKRRSAYINDSGPTDWVGLERDARDYELAVESGVEVQYPSTDIVVYQAPVRSLVTVQ